MTEAKILHQASGSNEFRQGMDVWSQITDRHIPTLAQGEDGDRFEVEFKEYDDVEPEDILTLTVRRVEKEEKQRRFLGRAK